MKYIAPAFLITFLTFGLSFADNSSKDKVDRVSYSIGYQIGGDFRQLNMDLDPDVLLKGIEEGLSEAKPQISPGQMHKTLLEMKNRIEFDQRQQKQASVEKYRGEGRDFLAANAGKEGVITLPSGLQYRVISEGTGRNPGPADKVIVHYRGTLIDGTEFGSSYRGEGKPATFSVNGVIKGLGEALQLMKEGARWQLFMPADLAYGERGPVGERPVIFDIVLISVNSGE